MGKPPGRAESEAKFSRPRPGEVLARPDLFRGSLTGRMGRLLQSQAARFEDQVSFGGRILVLAWLGLRRNGGLMFRLTLDEVFKLARGAVPLAILVGFMLGYLWSMLWYGALSNIGGLENIATFLVSIHTIQITPIMITVIAVLRYGAPMTWELAVMKSGRQFETLARMGIPPEHYLAVPRIAGSLLAVPALLAVFSLASFIGAYYLAWRHTGQPVLDFVFSLSNQTTGGHFAVMIFKSVAISLSVSFFCVYNGFKMGTDGLQHGTAIIRRAMGESFFYSILLCVLISVLYG